MTIASDNAVVGRLPHVLRRDPATAQLWREQPGARRAYLTMFAVTVLAGVLLVTCDLRRTKGPAYRVINEAGGPMWIGTGLLVLAALLVVAPLLHPRAARWALVATSAAHLVIGSSFLVSAVSDVNVGPLAPVYVAGMATWAISQAELYRTLRGPRK